MIDSHGSSIRLKMMLFLVLGFMSLLAAKDPYYPFAQVVRPKLFPVTPLQRLENSFPDDVTLGFAGNRGKADQVLMTLEIQEQGTVAEIYDRSEQPIRGPVLVSRLHNPGNGYVADLNGDKKLDYVIDVWSGGNGIAAAICETVFFLSNPSGYSILVVNSWAPEKEDFLDLLGNGHCQLLHRSFIDGDPITGKDGRVHNHWVYNLLEVVEDRLELRNSAASGFPKWILYTFRENHEATDQLTVDQKNRLWKAQVKCLFWPLEEPRDCVL